MRRIEGNRATRELNTVCELDAYSIVVHSPLKWGCGNAPSSSALDFLASTECCLLWALEKYREHAQYLKHPVLLPLAKGVCELLSRNAFSYRMRYSDRSPTTSRKRRLLIMICTKRLGRISLASDKDNNSWRGESRIVAASLCEAQRPCTSRRPQGGGYSNYQMFTRLSAGRTMAESSGTLNAF